jgi:hypothetical protein
MEEPDKTIQMAGNSRVARNFDLAVTHWARSQTKTTSQAHFQLSSLAKDLSEPQNGCCSNPPKGCLKARTGGKAVRKVGCSGVGLGIEHVRKRLTISPISVEVKDISLTDYIQIRHAVYLPHTAGRYAKKQFKKAQMPIVERLVDRYVKHTNSFRGIHCIFP